MPELSEQDDREAITDEALWDFADDLLDAWGVVDVNPPSLSEQFRDMFVARFRRSPEPQQVAEYEYGLLNPDSCTGEPHLYSTDREHIEREHRRGHPASQIVRRVKAGPWERVPDTEGSEK